MKSDVEKLKNIINAKYKKWCDEWQMMIVEYDDINKAIDQLTEPEDVCPECGGDGIETCTNPDHGFISAIGGEIGRLGCPVCGHDPDHKTGDTCQSCNGTGKKPEVSVVGVLNELDSMIVEDKRQFENSGMSTKGHFRCQMFIAELFKKYSGKG